MTPKQEALTDEQKDKAARLASEILAYLDSNRQHESAREQNFVEIGERLASIRTERLWRAFGFKNFSLYMKSMDSRTQNYHCMGVARDLLPYVSKADLVAMGISKATSLRLMVKGAKPITQELIDLAKQGTQEALEGEVAKQLGLVEDEEPGTSWFSFGGAYMNDEEKAEFLRTMNLAVKVGSIESEKIESWQGVPSGKKKQCMAVLCAEFQSSYATA